MANLTEPQDISVVKGTRVLVRRMTAHLASLAGMQMKTGLNIEEFEGTITHIYGDHPTNPTKVVFMVKKDDGIEVEIEQKHIVAVVKEIGPDANVPAVS